MNNNKLHNAKKAKNDEFYTLYEDIEKELIHYKEYFKDKIVYCNCDNPKYSNFWKYFYDNFKELQLKQLISTYYVKQDLLNNHITYKTIYDGNNIIQTQLKSTGDFRSLECIELLKEVDIVVTNPPFSLFKEYFAQLIDYNKKFIIIGNQNAVTYKTIFNLIKNNKIWLGYGFPGNAGFFASPYEDTAKSSQHKSGMIRISGVMWFTNLKHNKQNEFLELTKLYNPIDYPKYENYNAINVDLTSDIPYDYFGIIGVPITFMRKYCPEQFEIVSLGIVGSCEFTNNREMIILDKDGNETNKRTWNAKGTLYRKHLPSDKKPAAFKDVQTGELYQSIYARILIKRRDNVNNYK